jgi:hypothetical protein
MELASSTVPRVTNKLEWLSINLLRTVWRATSNTMPLWALASWPQVRSARMAQGAVRARMKRSHPRADEKQIGPWYGTVLSLSFIVVQYMCRRLREISIFGEISSTGFQQAVCKTYVFFGTKSFASSLAFSCTKTRERKTAAGIATYWPLYIKIDHYTYQCHCVSCRDVPTKKKLFVRKGERNKRWHASTPAGRAGVGPSFGGACHARSHWIQSIENPETIYTFLIILYKKIHTYLDQVLKTRKPYILF